jgi:uncharacterized membrane protein
MSASAATYFQKHNPAVLGVLAGLGLRVVWETGILPSFALVLRDIGIITWAILNDLAAACSAFLQFAIS